ncbi:MAG: hypothetical protein N2512_11325 [Armatimonadetes bacterium]|nr:hypothetical protein [Armatimonadota bacterium]
MASTKGFSAVSSYPDHGNECEFQRRDCSSRKQRERAVLVLIAAFLGHHPRLPRRAIRFCTASGTAGPPTLSAGEIYTCSTGVAMGRCQQEHLDVRPEHNRETVAC